MFKKCRLRFSVCFLAMALLLPLLSSCGPFPRGSRVDSEYYTYYKNIFGIYFISIEHSLDLITHGSWNYLDDADEATFEVLRGGRFAKDKSHVWYCGDIISDVDVGAFMVSATGVPHDINHVYVRGVEDCDVLYRPAADTIDVNTAEYFIAGNGWEEYDENWIKDKRYVYYCGRRIDVDRATFKPMERTNSHYMDKNFIYKSVDDSDMRTWKVVKICAIQQPVELPADGSCYLRNGRDILYCDSLILQNIDVHRFEEIGVGNVIVNDMLFYDGKQVLKDSLDVKHARFYLYGRIAIDNKHLYFDRKPLQGIDVMTFHQTKESPEYKYEDKNFRYKLRDDFKGLVKMKK